MLNAISEILKTLNKCPNCLIKENLRKSLYWKIRHFTQFSCYLLCIWAMYVNFFQHCEEEICLSWVYTDGGYCKIDKVYFSLGNCYFLVIQICVYLVAFLATLDSVLDSRPTFNSTINILFFLSTIKPIDLLTNKRRRYDCWILNNKSKLEKIHKRSSYKV